MSDQTLFLLDTIIAQIDKKEIELIITEQVKNEFYCNRPNVINTSIIDLRKSLNINLIFPALLKNYKGIKKVDSIRAKLSEKYQLIIDEFVKRATNPQSNINKKIDKLFTRGRVMNENDQIIQRAHIRHLRGNPPFKDNHDFGDCITWEALLEYASDADLTIISNDGDYEFVSYQGKGEIKDFLMREWKNRNNKDVVLVKSLGEFLKPYIDKEKIKTEAIEEAIIEEKDASRISGMVISEIPPGYASANFLNGNAVISGLNNISTCDPSLATFGVGGRNYYSAEINNAGLTNIASSNLFAGTISSLGMDIVNHPACLVCGKEKLISTGSSICSDCINNGTIGTMEGLK